MFPKGEEMLTESQRQNIFGSINKQESIHLAERNCDIDDRK
jgi:hypothetical protein